MKQTVGLNYGSFVFVFSIQERDAKVSTSVYGNFSYDTIHVFIHQKTDKRSKNCLLLSKISQSNCNWLFFAVKYETPYGGIRDSEQLRRDTIWGYPEYGASNCVRHMVSPGLDGLVFIWSSPGILLCLFPSQLCECWINVISVTPIIISLYTVCRLLLFHNF